MYALGITYDVDKQRRLLMANFLRNLVENDKAELRRTGRIADQVMALEDKYKAMSDEELRAQTAEFRNAWKQVLN